MIEEKHGKENVLNSMSTVDALDAFRKYAA